MSLPLLVAALALALGLLFSLPSPTHAHVQHVRLGGGQRSTLESRAETEGKARACGVRDASDAQLAYESDLVAAVLASHPKWAHGNR